MKIRSSCLFLLTFTVTLGAQAERLPLEAYASLPQVANARLSPNGQFVATQVNAGDFTHIMTVPVGANERPRSVLSTDNIEFRISWFEWVNDDRLFVSVRYPKTSLGGTGVMESELFTVERDGSGFRKLIDVRRARWVPQFRDRVIDFLPDDPDHVLMELDMAKPNLRDVYRVNVETGARRRVQRGRANVDRWFTDRQSRVRGYVQLDGTRARVSVVDPTGKQWRDLWAFDWFSSDRVLPMGFDHDPNILYVRAFHDGRLAIFRTDLRDETPQRELVHADPDYDVEGALLYSSSLERVIGFRDDRRDENAYVIWDRDYASGFDAARRALPGTRNVLIDASRDERRYILLATSQTHPGTYYLGDRDAGQLAPFGQRYPQLPPDSLVGKRKVQYTAQDGTSIDAYLTLPASDEEDPPLPAVILPHGGPAARTNPGFDYWTEFLASRGYAVLEMDFRGSSGQGLAWLASAFARWDRITQQDIADGAEWLIDEGIADPARICIVGASFGGYAALMGPIKYPKRYRCAVSFAGVADLVMLRNRWRRFVNASLMENQIGSDTERLRQGSPLHQAARLDVPVLLVHGATDRVVEIDQSRSMLEALKDHRKNVRYVELETGDHYLSRQADRIRFFQEMERFLEENLQ